MAGSNEDSDVIDYKRALQLDTTAFGVAEITPEAAFTAIEKLELRQWLSEVKWEAKRTFGKFLEVQLPEGVMTCDVFETAQALKRNIEGLSELVETSTNPDVRIAATAAAAQAARSYKELCDSIMKRAKERQEANQPKPLKRMRGPNINGL